MAESKLAIVSIDFAVKVLKMCNEIKAMIDEELWDVINYALAIANIYDIDIEQVIKVKSEMSESKYPSNIRFEEGR